MAIEPTGSQDKLSEPVSVGRILAAHGVRGELRVQPLSDLPERFKEGSTLWLEGEPHQVERSQARGRSLHLKLSSVNDRNAAEAIVGALLTVPEPAPLEGEGLYYQHDLIGLRVENPAGEVLGSLVQIIETGANDVYVIHGDGGELLLPATNEVIKRVDLAAGRLSVELLPGLEFQPWTAGKATRGNKANSHRGD